MQKMSKNELNRSIHASMKWIIILSLSEFVLLTRGQSATLSDIIPLNLRECYNQSYMVVRDNLLPMTTTNFIALIRKLEDSTYSLNSRLLAPAILYKYRYDGIERHPDIQTTEYVKPYSRSGKEYYLYKLQMDKIIPATLSSISAIPDDVLTPIEKCTLHAMLSLSIDKYDRGDGDVSCNLLSKYSQWNTRYPRDLSKARDVEFLWPQYDGEISGNYHDTGMAGQFQLASGYNYQTAVSKCPMENGVVYDKYGSLTPGIVLAGLAAGLNYQAVPYNSYYVQPRTSQRRKVQAAVDHYRNLFASNPGYDGGRQGGGSFGWPNGGQGGGSGYPPYGGGNGHPQTGGGYGPNNQGGYQPQSVGQGGIRFGSNVGTGSQTGNGYGTGNIYGNNGNGYGTGNTYGNNGNGYGTGNTYGNNGNGYGSGNTYGNNGNGYGTGNTYGNSNGYGTGSGTGVNTGYGEVDIDSRYAATLAGSIALETLLQGPENLITIGNKGGWNSSSVPKYYFLPNWLDGNVLTDARITGGIDGLYLANYIQSWTNTAGSNYKLSQVIDAYYSDLGVLNSGVKACNRKNNFAQFSSQLPQQTYAVSYMLNNDLPPNVLIEPSGVATFSMYSAQSTSTYVPSLPVSQCPANSSLPFSQPYADLTVVVDCNLDFDYVAGILNNLAENCEFSKYGSNLTILSGKDGSVIREGIRTPLDIPRGYNTTVMGGFDFPRLLIQLKLRYQNKLQNEVYQQSAGGLPWIVIFVPMSSSMTDSDKQSALDSVNYFQFYMPDVRLMYLVPTGKEIWAPFALNKDRDIFISNQNSDLAITLQPLITRIAQIPRRLIDPNCGRYFSGGSYNEVSLSGYLSPNEIQYYRIHQNYFYGDVNGLVKVTKSYNAPTLTICSSRTNPNPSINSTYASNSDVTCTQLTGSTTYQYTVSNECPGAYYAAQCNPIYFSIYNSPSGSVGVNQFSCTDAQCRFPDQSKYTISHYGLTCHSSASIAFISPILLTILLGSAFFIGM